MSKELYMAAHEAEIEEYLEAHPDADWTEAYEATADGAYGRMRDDLADRADHYRDLQREGIAAAERAANDDPAGPEKRA